MNLNREILRLALPSILANITVPLVGMVDIAVVGHLGSADGVSGAALIGGIAIGSMLFDLLYWNFEFLRTGTGGLTAQAFGRGDGAGERHTLLRALRIALVAALGLIALQWVVVQAAFLVVDCTPEVRTLAEKYFYIRIWAAPATLSLFAFKGWFIGMQDSVRPMTCDLLVNGVNILLSLGLGFGLAGLPAMGFNGVALGTVIAQWTGFLYALIALRLHYRALFTGPVQPVREEDVSFFSLNRDLVLRSVGLLAVYIGFTVISARYGDVMLAVSSILMKLLMVFSYFTDGFAYAGEALTGRFIGARSPEGVSSTIRGTFVWSAGVAGFFVLLYGVGGMPIFRLMTSDGAVVEAGRQFLPWLLLMPLMGTPAFVWDGIYAGATDSRDLRNATLLCAAGFFAAWGAGIALLPKDGCADYNALAIHVLLGAYFVHLAVRTAYLTLRRKLLMPSQ